MEASRRGIVTRDQRGDDDYSHERRDDRDREPRRTHSHSAEKRARRHYDPEERHTEARLKRRTDDFDDETRHHHSSRHEAQGKKRHPSRSKHRSRSADHSRPVNSRYGRESSDKREHRRETSPVTAKRPKYREVNSDVKQRHESQDQAAEEVELFPESSHHHRSRYKYAPDYKHQTHLRRSQSRGSEQDLHEHVRSHRRGHHSPHRESALADHSRRHRSPERRWTQAEVDEYYRRQDEEAWRLRHDSPRSRHRDERHRPEPSLHEWSADRRHSSEHDYDRRHRAEYSHRYSTSPRPSWHDDRMEGTRPIQSVMDDREPRGQRIPSYDGSHRGRGRGRGGFENPRGRGGYHHSHGPPPPQIDTRHQYASNSHYGTPAGSYHGSPHSASPYSQHGGWQTPQHYYNAPPAHAYASTPQSRHGSYPPQQTPSYYPAQSHQYPPQQPQSAAYPPAAYRGGHAPARGGGFPQQDRRFSGPSASSPPQSAAQPASRGGRGHFQNLRWTAGSGSQGGKPPEGGSGPGSREQSVHSSAPPPPPPAKDPPPPPEEENPFRPSKAFRVEDDSAQHETPEPTKEPEPTSAQKEPKFSFAFKGKAAPAPTAKPVTDLTQKMKEPPMAPRREPPHDAPRKPNAFNRDGPQASQKAAFDKRQDASRDPRDRYADQRREREMEAERYKQERLAAAAKTDRRPPREPEKDRAKDKPQVVKVKETRKRAKPRPQVDPELKESKSVYFRKQGNESVVGSGTYGKVYKGVHVYTGALVALKKIRMEGEKDGFPVTAVREIKLLQSLRHENVVRLQEVMVESNDCYMVFEYLSHDLTGLLNHPTFKLDHAHKKDLAKQLFQSLDYLHRRGVLHRDLKAANILVSSNGQLKLADFGLARFYSKHHTLDYTNRVITIWYRPPELLLGETQYGPAVDVWSAACVLVEIFTRHAIFPGDGGEINQLEKIYNILGTPTRNEWPGLADMAWFELLRPAERRRNVFREKYAERVSPEAFELLSAMFQYDPAKRPAAEDVLQHPYFTTEEPAPKQVTELANVDGDWHEFESKALRKENERRARKVAEAEKDKAKRRASSQVSGEAREAKRIKSESMADTGDTSARGGSADPEDTGVEMNLEPS